MFACENKKKKKLVTDICSVMQDSEESLIKCTEMQVTNYLPVLVEFLFRIFSLLQMARNEFNM